MAFTVEDGAQVVGANSYASIANVTDYLTDRGRQAENGWSTAATAAQQAALVLATDYMDKRWGSRYRGRRKGTDAEQGLRWPRVGACDNDGNAYPDDELPIRLIQACAEYAVRALGGELVADPAAPPPGNLKRSTDKVDVLEETREYFGPAESGGQSALLPAVASYPAADLLMLDLVTGDPFATGQIAFGRVMRA